MDGDFLKGILLSGKSGIFLINLTQKIKRFKDLKIFENIFEKLKRFCFSFEVLFCTYEKSKILCYWEYSRQYSLGNGSFYYQSLSDISLQILREVGRKNMGLFQNKLSKELGLKSGEFSHHLTSLIKTGLIQKSQYFSNFLSSYSGLILLKSTYLNVKKKAECNFGKIFEKFQKLKPNNLVKKSIKIFARTGFFVEQKDLKYGIFYDLINFKNIDKKKIHRTWQKIRLKLFKSGLLIENNKIKIKKNYPKIEVSKIFVEKFFLKNCATISKVNQEKLLFLLKQTPITIIQKIIKKIKIPGISTPKLIEKTRGYIDLKNIQLILKNFEKYRGFLKFYQQIGRQRILNYYNPNTSKIKIFKNLNSKSANVISDQNTKRKILLLSWIKSYILPVKDIGKKIAIYEKKGLTKVDIKVIRRILSDLIRQGKLKIIKVYNQTINNKPQEIEYVMKRDFNLKNLKVFPSFPEFPDFYFNKKPKLNCCQIKKLPNTSSVDTKILPAFFSLYTNAINKENFYIYKNLLKNGPSNYFLSGIKDNRCFLLTMKPKRISDLIVLKVKKKNFKFLHIIPTLFRYIPIFFSLRYFFFYEKFFYLDFFIEKKNIIIKKKSFLIKRDFFLILLVYFCRKNIFNTKFLLKKNFSDSKKKIYKKKILNNKRFFSLNKKSFYIYFKPLKKIYSKKRKSFRNKYQKNKIKWGSQFDVNIIENKFCRASRKIFSLYTRNKKVSLDRRLKGLINLSNIKIALYLFKKFDFLKCSKLFYRIFSKFSFIIKRALEYPDFSLLLNFTKIEHFSLFQESPEKNKKILILFFLKKIFEIYFNTNKYKSNSWILTINYFFLNILCSRIYSLFVLIFFKKDKKKIYIKNAQNKKIFEKQNNKINRSFWIKVLGVLNFFTNKIKKNRFFINFQNSNTFVKSLIIRKLFVSILPKSERFVDSKLIKKQNSKFGNNIEIRLFEKRCNYEISEQQSKNIWNQKIIFFNFLQKKKIPKKINTQKTKMLFSFFKKIFTKHIHMPILISFKKKYEISKKKIFFNMIFCKFFFFSKKIYTANLRNLIMSLKNRKILNLKSMFFRYIFLKKYLSNSYSNIQSLKEFFAKNFFQKKLLFGAFFNFLIEGKIRGYKVTGTKYYGSVFFSFKHQLFLKIKKKP